MTTTRYVLFACVIAILQSAVAADHENHLPPLPPWNPQNLGLIAAPDDPWITPAELSGLTTTPRYDETIQWLKKLDSAAREINLVSIGRSDQGREIWMVVAAKNGATTPKRLARSGKPLVLAQAGIHAGEIDGKDAGLMLLRDLTVSGQRAALLDRVNLLFIPVLNVDGHERFSAYGRINQRGPAEMGWRTNGRNLNLNRDYAKLETPGVRAVVQVIDEWQPDLYIDLHVTDGIDYQYDITWGYNGTHAWSPAIAGWLTQYLEPAATAALNDRGHVPGPLVFAKNYDDYSAGISAWTAGPRYSNGYGDARHLPTVLVENHSLKPYLQRVLGTYVFLEAVLQVAGEHGTALREAIAKDRNSRPDPVVLSWKEGAGTLPESLFFKGVESFREYSPVTGDSIVRWTGQPVELPVAVRAGDQPGELARRPASYYIPAEWGDIAQRLRDHGITVSTLDEPRIIDVRRYRLPSAVVASGANPFEGRLRIDPGAPVPVDGPAEFRPGDFVVDTDQPLGTLAMLLLEPLSPDSFLQWGYFLEIMNRTEYFEDYAVEPLAAQMMRNDPDLARRFRERLDADPAFAADPVRRLHWFYGQTPFHDQRYRLYPVARSVNPQAD